MGSSPINSICLSMSIYLNQYNEEKNLKKKLNFPCRNYNTKRKKGNYTYTTILKQFLKNEQIAKYIDEKIVQKYFDKSFLNPETGHIVSVQYLLFKLKNYESRRRISAGDLNLYKEFLDWFKRNKKSVNEDSRSTSMRYMTKKIISAKLFENLNPFISYKNQFKSWEMVEPLQASISINCKILEVVNNIANGKLDSLKTGFIYPKVNSNLVENSLEYHNELINKYDILKKTTETLGLIDGLDAETTSCIIFGLTAVFLPAHYELCSGTVFLSNTLDLQQIDMPIFMHNFSELLKYQCDIFFNNTPSSLLLDHLIFKNTKFCLLDSDDDTINSFFDQYDSTPDDHGVPSAIPKLFYHDPDHLQKF